MVRGKVSSRNTEKYHKTPEVEQCSLLMEPKEAHCGWRTGKGEDRMVTKMCNPLQVFELDSEGMGK